MKNNPDIAALTAELEAAKLDQKSAKGRYLPRVDAEYTDTYSRGAGGAPTASAMASRDSSTTFRALRPAACKLEAFPTLLSCWLMANTASGTIAVVAALSRYAVALLMAIRQF